MDVLLLSIARVAGHARVASRPLLQCYTALLRVIPPSATPYSTMTSPQPAYEFVEDVERIHYYRPGGYHPVYNGDTLYNRYHVIHKHGYGSFSTTWLAHDQELKRYVAIKIGIASSNHHEFDVLSHISDRTACGKENSTSLVLEVVDHFSFDGPNGTHFCLVTNPARCSVKDVREASSSGLFQLPVARALAAQLAIAVRKVHDQGYVHGGRHAKNFVSQTLQLALISVASRLHSSRSPHGQYSAEDVLYFHRSTEAQLYKEFGEPEPEPVVRLDNPMLPPGVPSHVIPPIWMGKPSEEFTLSEAHILLADFGAAFSPLGEPRLQSYTPLDIRPPEARFETSKPLSFASDIWSLGCTIWAILGQRSLFDAIIATEDDMTCEHMDALEHLPQDWWVKWDGRHKKFLESGEPKPGRKPWTWNERFEDSIQEPRRRKKLGTLDGDEEAALFEMIRWMLKFKPTDRPTAAQVLNTRWMRDWALPEFSKML